MASDKILLGLVAYHGKTLMPEQLEDYIWFCDSHEKVIFEIVSRWKYKNAPTARFPSLMDLSAIANDLQNEQWQKEKAAETDA